jgi:hypothetical protein
MYHWDLNNNWVTSVDFVEWTWLALEWPSSYFFGQITSAKMFTSWLRLDCILEHILKKH